MDKTPEAMDVLELAVEYARALEFAATNFTVPEAQGTVERFRAELLKRQQTMEEYRRVLLSLIDGIAEEIKVLYAKR